jgi:hypothetical protein
MADLLTDSVARTNQVRHMRDAFAWPPAGGVWILSFPADSELYHRYLRLVEEHPKQDEHLVERAMQWVEVVRELPSAVYAPDASSNATATAVLAALARSNLAMPDSGPTGIWLRSVQFCRSGNSLLAWTKDGGVWIAPDLSQHQMEAAEKVFWPKARAFNFLTQQARSEVIERLGGVFFERPLDSHNVQRFLKGSRPCTVDERGQLVQAPLSIDYDE